MFSHLPQCSSDHVSPLIRYCQNSPYPPTLTSRIMSRFPVLTSKALNGLALFSFLPCFMDSVIFLLHFELYRDETQWVCKALWEPFWHRIRESKQTKTVSLTPTSSTETPLSPDLHDDASRQEFYWRYLIALKGKIKNQKTHSLNQLSLLCEPHNICFL